MTRPTEHMWQAGWQLLGEMVGEPICDDTTRVLVHVGIDICDDAFLNGNWYRFRGAVIEIQRVLRNGGGFHA